MRAVCIAGPGRVDLVDVPTPLPTGGEVRVRVEWAAICGTDRKLARLGAGRPRVPGHEFAGLADDHTPVAVHPDIGCGACAVCRTGMTNRCERRTSIGIDRDGGFAQWTTVPAAHAVEVADVPLELAPLLEPLACCVHALSLLPSGMSHAAVIGAGAMGLLTMWALQAQGVRVAVCQRSPQRRELAVELGADVVVGPEDDPRVALDAPVEAVVVTAPGREALDWALARVAVGGTVHAFAGTSGGALVDANTVHYRHLSLVGSTGSTLRDYRAALDLVRAGRVELARLPRARIALDEVPAALIADPDTRHVRTLVAIGGGTS